MTKQEFLAMSLPYELKMLQSCEHWYTPEPNRVVLLTGIADIDGKAPMEYGNEPTETTIFYRLSKDITGTDYVLRFKPILRPLSDITKPIEHKGERFVPLHRLLENNNFDLSKMSEDEIMSFQKPFMMPELIILNDLPLYLELHFDIADLISKGEAIDVNTLETNPYK